MKITRIFASQDGHSHFEDMEIPLKDGGKIGKLSEEINVKKLIFRRTEGDYNFDWHTAPRKQYIIMLGDVEIETSDGEKRLFKNGDIVLVEDTTGKGHKSKAINEKPRNSVFITLEQEFKIKPYS